MASVSGVQDCGSAVNVDARVGITLVSATRPSASSSTVNITFKAYVYTTSDWTYNSIAIYYNDKEYTVFNSNSGASHNTKNKKYSTTTLTATVSTTGTTASIKVGVNGTAWNPSSAKKTFTFTVSDISAPKYTVSYNANGGTNAPSSQTKTYGTALTLRDGIPTKTGYTFKSWNTKKDGSGTSYSSKGTYKTNSAVTLYAQWTENKLTVNYYGNGANYAAYKGVETTENLVLSVEFLYDNAYSSGLANVQNTDYLYLSRTGYAPTGYWGTSTSGGILVNQNTSFSTGQALAQALDKSLESGNATVDLYAQWQENAYILAYDSNGGSGEMASQTIEWGTLFNLSNNTFKRAGYKFIGWNAYRNSDNTWYVSGQGWITEDEITTNGYSKKIYENQSELTFDNSWIVGNEEARLYTMYAVWEMSGGVVYIDNGIIFEPYLTYIDNGTSWDAYLIYIYDDTNWNMMS